MDFGELIQRLNSQGLPFERKLGNRGNRDALAVFHKTHPDIFQAIAVDLIYRFATMNSYTPDELDAYRQAVSDFGESLRGCVEEFDLENLKASSAESEE